MFMLNYYIVLKIVIPVNGVKGMEEFTMSWRSMETRATNSTSSHLGISFAHHKILIERARIYTKYVIKNKN